MVGNTFSPRAVPACMRANTVFNTSDLHATDSRLSSLHSSKALIHKSPDVSYRTDGSVITRLCLKVDADYYRDSPWGIIYPAW